MSEGRSEEFHQSHNIDAMRSDLGTRVFGVSPSKFKSNSGRKLYPNDRGEGHKPDIGRVHMAVQGGHISVEEGVDLNPKYDPAKKKYNDTQATKIRTYDRDPEGVKDKRRVIANRRKERIADKKMSSVKWMCPKCGVANMIDFGKPLRCAECIYETTGKDYGSES